MRCASVSRVNLECRRVPSNRYCVVRCATAEIRLHAPRDATNIAPAARRRSGRIANWRSRALPGYGTSPHSE
jgi:hypothetical protein